MNRSMHRLAFTAGLAGFVLTGCGTGRAPRRRTALQAAHARGDDRACAGKPWSAKRELTVPAAAARDVADGADSVVLVYGEGASGSPALTRSPWPLVDGERRSSAFAFAVAGTPVGQTCPSTGSRQRAKPATCHATPLWP
jgi:hypothetical protein